MELGGDPGRDAMAIKGRFPGQNRLYENLGEMRFRDVTGDVGLGQTTADSFTTVFADFTDDGWPDLYVALDHRADLFYVNSSRDASGSPRREHGVGHVGNDMGVAVTDLGSDGTLDLYSTNISDPNDQFGTGSGNTLLVGRRGTDGTVTYADEAEAAGVDDTGWGWGTAFTDLEPRRPSRPVRRPGHAGIHRAAEPRAPEPEGARLPRHGRRRRSRRRPTTAATCRATSAR